LDVLSSSFAQEKVRAVLFILPAVAMKALSLDSGHWEEA
jgi:hypothetical protein